MDSFINLSKPIDKQVIIDNNLWVEKYRPCTLNSIYGNYNNIKKIKDWINNFKSKSANTKPALLIIGPPGIGKTTTAKCILNNSGYDTLEFNASDIRAQKNIREKLSKILTSSNIKMLIEKKNRIKAVIMDEIDGMISGDRGGISEFISIICPNKKKGRKKKNEQNTLPHLNPFICISNKNNEKKINDLKKHCETIYFEKPSFNDIKKLIIEVSIKENLEIDSETINTIINKSQFDYRRVLGILQEMQRSSKNDFIINDNSTLSLYHAKDIDYTLNESLDEIFHNYNNCKNCLKFYTIDKNLIPLIIHENSIQHIFDSKNNKIDNKLKIESYSNILDCLSLGDKIDKNMYGDQNWDLYLENGVNKCVYPSYYLNKFESSISNYNYSTLLTKSCQQFSSYKDIINLLPEIKCNKIIITQVILSIVNNIFDNNKEYGIKLLINNNLNIDHLHKLLKICKTDVDYKKIYTCKSKTSLSKTFDKLIKYYPIFDI